MDDRERIERILPGLEPDGRYAAGCPMNKTGVMFCEFLYSRSANPQEIKEVVDEHLESRRRELRELAEVGFVEGKSYASDPRWIAELRAMSRLYERGDIDDSEEAAALRGVLAEVCACDEYEGFPVVSEELMRRYVQLVFDSWKEL